MSISGDYAVVGNNGDAECGVEASAFFFHYNGAAWEEQARVGSGAAGAGYSFGESVSICGATAAAAEPDVWNDVGAVYLFERDGPQWTAPEAAYPGEGEGGEGEVQPEAPPSSGTFAKLTPERRPGCGPLRRLHRSGRRTRHRGRSFRRRQRKLLRLGLHIPALFRPHHRRSAARSNRRRRIRHLVMDVPGRRRDSYRAGHRDPSPRRVPSQYTRMKPPPTRSRRQETEPRLSTPPPSRRSTRRPYRRWHLIGDPGIHRPGRTGAPVLDFRRCRFGGP